MNKYDVFQKMIEESNSIVFFGGAGTSTDCGLPDFRGTNGLYSGEMEKQYAYPPETMLSHTFYERHTEEFFDFYRNEMIFDWAKPNEFHEKLVALEKSGKLKAIVTQNIDSLHQKAGSQNVIELHGSTARNYCTCCHKFFDEAFVKNYDGVPRCDECGAVVKPDVVLYEESLSDASVSNAIRAISQADMLIVAGTSLSVYPAAMYIDYFTGDNLVIINKQPTPRDKHAELVFAESVTDVFSHLDL